jgi:predicted secreted Zn-dependent protease
MDLENMLRASAPQVDIEASGAAARDVASEVATNYRRRPRRFSRRALHAIDCRTSAPSPQPSALALSRYCRRIFTIS